MNPTPAAKLRGWGVAAACWAVALTVLTACPSWLEVDDEDASDSDVTGALAGPGANPVVLPGAPADPGGDGLIVPNTPGLGVPLAGYWARVRLDVADVVLPYAWAGFMPAEDRVTFRLFAARRGADEAGPASPRLQAVVPIALPAGTDRSQLEGLTLGEDALAAGVVSLQTTRKDQWLITLTRLSFEEVDDRLVKGSMEGIARRGSKGQRTRSFEMGFLALRAPER